MSLSYDATQTVNAGGLLLSAACSRPSASEVVVAVVAGSQYYLRRYSTAGGHSQVGSDITLSSSPSLQPFALAMVTNDRVAGLSGNNTNSFITDIPAVTTVNSNVGRYTYQNTQRSQIIAGIPSGGIGYGITDLAATLVKFDGTGNTMSTITTDAFFTAADIFSCIVAKDTSGFILGTEGGRIIELDLTGKVVRQYVLPTYRNVSKKIISGYFRGVSQLAYYSGYLMVETQLGEVYLFDHDSGLVIQRFTTHALNSGLTFPGLILSAASGPTVFSCFGGSPGLGSPIAEWDMCTTPLLCRDVINVNNSGSRMNDIGFVGANVWALNLSGSKLFWATYSASRTVVQESVTFVDGGSNPIAGEVIAIDDSLTPAQVMFHSTIPAAGKQLPLTTGKDVLLVSSSGKGSDQQFDVRRIAT